MSSLIKTKHYIPPSTSGNIYVVVKYRQTNFGTDSKTFLSIKWGSWSHESTVSTTWNITSGFVLKLKHSKNDSERLTIKTNGNFKSEITQGKELPEWRSRSWQNVEL